MGMQEYIAGAAELGRAEGATRERRVLETAVRRAFAVLDEKAQSEIYNGDVVGEMIENNLSEDSVVPDMLENMIAAAEQHGEDSDPDHTCGDLQDYLTEISSHMTPEQSDAFLADPVIKALHEQGQAAASRPARNW